MRGKGGRPLEPNTEHGHTKNLGKVKRKKTKLYKFKNEEKMTRKNAGVMA